MKKKIILKVSDFRSAFIQSKFLAKRGLEVYEFRVESGLNCGGHAFPSRGQLLPTILKEFNEKWDELTVGVRLFVQQFYQKMNWPYPSADKIERPYFSVQGGVGNSGEAQRLVSGYKVDRVGWGTPFLLVPEVTNVDDPTRELLAKAKKDDVYLSDVSPLGVPFNNIRGTKSERWTTDRVQQGKPGSPCPKGFAALNTEFSDRPMCVASYEYQKKKLAQIEELKISEMEKNLRRKEVVQKTCICDHLGNGVMIKLGIANEQSAPQAICPGPNIMWFDRIYSLEEMVDHIYGRGVSLVPAERPHMFANEMILNVDYFETLLERHTGNSEQLESLMEFKTNLEKGMDDCLVLSNDNAFEGENLQSLSDYVTEQRLRLTRLFHQFKERLALVPSLN